MTSLGIDLLNLSGKKLVVSDTNRSLYVHLDDRVLSAFVLNN